MYGSGLIGTELRGPGVCVSKPEEGIQMHFGAVVNNPITDKAGNVKFISSDGMVFDGTAPVFNGVQDGGEFLSAEDEIGIIPEFFKQIAGKSFPHAQGGIH